MHAKTTIPGYKNERGQVVVAATGHASTTFPGQTIYRLRCSHCRYEYGSNGCDIHKRRCPRHDGGVEGEPLRDPAPNLFGW